MLVKQYFEESISDRPLRYQTKINMVRCLKKLELWNLPYSQITPSFCWNKIEGIINQNVKRVYAGYIRNIFNYDQSQIPVVMGIARIYDLPTAEELITIIERSKYRLQLLLCMYAGLRVGEACAIRPKDLRGDRLIINRQLSQKGELLPAKTVGQVILPHWLAEFVNNMDETDWWPANKPSKHLTDHCIKLSRKTKVKVTPHLLRHWYATEMIRATKNPELVRRQLRHARLDTTLQVYAQVSMDDLDALVNRAFPG